MAIESCYKGPLQVNVEHCVPGGAQSCCPHALHLLSRRRLISHQRRAITSLRFWISYTGVRKERAKLGKYFLKNWMYLIQLPIAPLSQLSWTCRRGRPLHVALPFFHLSEAPDLGKRLRTWAFEIAICQTNPETDFLHSYWCYVCQDLLSVPSNIAPR